MTSKHIKSPFSAVASSISRVKSVGVPPPEPPSTVTVPELVVTGTAENVISTNSIEAGCPVKSISVSVIDAPITSKQI